MDYPREWTRSEIRKLIVELLLEIEIEKRRGTDSAYGSVPLPRPRPANYIEREEN